jgi:hypothetical protein
MKVMSHDRLLHMINVANVQVSDVNLCLLGSAPFYVSKRAGSQLVQDENLLDPFRTLCCQLAADQAVLVIKGWWLYEQGCASWTPQFHVLYPASDQALVMFR